MNDAQIRRRPQQERSKAKVETILDVALDLIVESGAENLAIREVARRAGVPSARSISIFRRRRRSSANWPSAIWIG
jgi:AcrR family transcriptional regulator